MITFAFEHNEYRTSRIVGDIEGKEAGPNVMFVGGIHGNEPSGVVAIQRLFADLKSRDVPIRGRVIGVVGNMAALERNTRYLSRDMNRIWDQEFLNRYSNGCRAESSDDTEYQEACAVYEIIEPFLPKPDSPSSKRVPPSTPDFYLFDLHTTSSETVPFISMNDQLINRNFALQFPVPTILGIEEYLKGPLLSYVNDFGPVAFAFEAGKHDDPVSIDRHLSFIYQALVLAGVLTEDQVPDYESHVRRLKDHSRGESGILEVIYRHAVAPEDQFVMEKGFQNFMRIDQGAVLANDRNGPIVSEYDAKIFMPLYQSQGEDGFFIVRPVNKNMLKLSSVLRNYNFEKALRLLPGISSSETDGDALVVNKRVARFLAVELFHLLGYRRKRDDGNHITFVRREVGQQAKEKI